MTILYFSIRPFKENSLCIIGDEDPFYEQGIINRLLEENLETLVINGADHGLDIDSDLMRSIDNLKSIVASVENFIINSV